MDDQAYIPDSSRLVKLSDLKKLAKKLNETDVKYIVMGGLAVIESGYARATYDLDLLLLTDRENVASALDALSILEDNAAAEVDPEELPEYLVIRICDEITVDLMAKACGVDYETAEPHIKWTEIDGVKIPFASPLLLWWTKQTYRDKDKMDLMHINRLLEAEGYSIPPPPL